MELDAFFHWNSIATRVNMSSVKIIRADISCLDHSGPMFHPPKPSDLDPYFPFILKYLYNNTILYNPIHIHIYIYSRYIYIYNIYLPCFPEDISAFSRSMDLRNKPLTGTPYLRWANRGSYPSSGPSGQGSVATFAEALSLPAWDGLGWLGMARDPVGHVSE